MKNKILYLLLSVVIAFGLWGYVITTVSPEWEETYYDIPVALKNEKVLHENGLMLNEKETPTVTLRLKGNRSDLINLNKSDITLVADLVGHCSINTTKNNYANYSKAKAREAHRKYVG